MSHPILLLFVIDLSFSLSLRLIWNEFNIIYLVWCNSKRTEFYIRRSLSPPKSPCERKAIELHKQHGKIQLQVNTFKKKRKEKGISTLAKKKIDLRHTFKKEEL